MSQSNNNHAKMGKNMRPWSSEKSIGFSSLSSQKDEEVLDPQRSDAADDLGDVTDFVNFFQQQSTEVLSHMSVVEEDAKKEENKPRNIPISIRPGTPVDHHDLHHKLRQFVDDKKVRAEPSLRQKLGKPTPFPLRKTTSDPAIKSRSTKAFKQHRNGRDYNISNRPSPRTSTPNTPLLTPVISTVQMPTPSPQQSLQPPQARPQVPWEQPTGFIYDDIFLRHGCICAEAIHEQNNQVMGEIFQELHAGGLLNRVVCARARPAIRDEVMLVHSHVHWFKMIEDYNDEKNRPEKLPCGAHGLDLKTLWNNYTTQAVLNAAGSLIELCNQAIAGDIKNGFALIQPAGHSASFEKAKNGSYCNNVAIAARHLQLGFGLNRIAIIDWDLDHGSGTQEIFYEDRNVLVISIHKMERDFVAAAENIGYGEGTGFNINIPWFYDASNPEFFGDVEYMAAFHSIVLPILASFNPDFVLVSAGFNAAIHDGSTFCVTPQGYAHMTRKTMNVCKDRLILSMENLEPASKLIPHAVGACMETLLGIQPCPFPNQIIFQRPSENAIRSLNKIISILEPFWPTLQHSRRYASYNLAEYQENERNSAEVTISETAEVLASMSVKRTGEPA